MMRDSCAHMSNLKYCSLRFLLRKLNFFCHHLMRVNTAKMLLAVRKMIHEQRMVRYFEKLVT